MSQNVIELAKEWQETFISETNQSARLRQEEKRAYLIQKPNSRIMRGSSPLSIGFVTKEIWLSESRKGTLFADEEVGKRTKSEVSREEQNSQKSQQFKKLKS
jgi:hypothetical protein